MGTPVTTGPETTGAQCWNTPLTSGGFTAVPRWTTAPVPGTAQHEAEIPAALTTALRRLARDLAVTPSSVLLCAHLKVLSALSGVRDVGCGYVAVPGGPPLPFRLSLDSRSWRTLLLATHRAASAMAPRHPVPAGGLRTGTGVPTSSAEDEAGAEAVFDPYGGGRPGTDAALRVSVTARGSRCLLRLRYRTEVLDGDCAARIAGYHLTALALMVDDPDADPGPQSLVGAAEVHRQIVGLAGPRRDLPDLRAHELFEQRARTRPDAVAAVQKGRHWTYGELNSRANRLAHALLKLGLRREDAVAVVSERNLGWMAAVLAVLKAGGAYVPIEPHFPADRITTMLTRSSCRFALVESSSTAALDRALDRMAEVRIVAIDAAYDDAHRADDPRVRVPADSLAYIYFTSGSTGEPKGVMCEHAGMLNHLYAKIDDLDIGEGGTVAQTAPQCFDISLWQLLAGPLAGGRTLLVEQETVLDVERFLDTVIAGRVAVLQVVPSYLDAVLASLERTHRDLPDLRCVSVTGEAVKKELVERWFACLPGIRLVNAYGLTETSDDTTHEVMDRVPDSDRVPLGRPVGNVRAYVVGPGLEPVPLGAPGEIVFSGVCVGRGYVGDPERTRLAFVADPHHPASRLYRSGDQGRWLPSGKLEFLGRRDTQVKIRGFRIELAEIEGALMRAPGIRAATVVAARRAGHEPFLAAFYTGAAAPDAGRLRDVLDTSLPAYMVPSAFHRLDRLPVTANGKTDTKALLALAEDRGEVRDGPRPPRTPAEQRLAAVWSQVLGIPVERIGRQDRFHDLGGTSLSALRVVVALDRKISFKDLTHHPCLADLARVLEDRLPAGDAP
ncbi:amino acid adenylation domain-containing protein [Streptomyces sp. NPDC001568]|uniref:non-ribosomal peptide synthetase n=1 Tax=Streptomyces sp. NPDC001568 TaxID=3364588 RepID=UPI0036BE2CC7